MQFREVGRLRVTRRTLGVGKDIRAYLSFGGAGLKVGVDILGGGLQD
jgi:hypothetical protein